MADPIVVDDSVEGKHVVNAEGDRVGVVSGVRGDTAYVDPDPGITDSLMSTLGWENVDDDDYPLDSESIERITDDEVHLKQRL